MAFGEDCCPRYHAPENLATLRKMALNLRHLDKTRRRGLKARSKIASWSEDFSLSVLTSQSNEP